MALAEETSDLRRLANVDPDAIMDGLNDSITRKMPSYRDLYLRWERLNWSVSDLDFTQDREDWLALDETYKERLLWTLSQFYVAEQRVAATLTPYILAARGEGQRRFLATQCVDEARHTVFFDRWFQEVVAVGDADLARRIRTSRDRVGPGFAPLFDEYLEDVTSDLRTHPQDIRRYAKAVAMYHIVIEGVLALTGQKFILAWARDNQLLPGFRAGFTAVARDESRHVAFGARVIRDLLDEDPTLIEPIHEGVRETLHLGTRLFQPPNGDVTYTSVFAYSLGDLFNYGSIQLEKKMRAIGIPLPFVEVDLPTMDAAWPPPGGGLIPSDARQKATSSVLRALGAMTPGLAPGLALMALHLAFDAEAAGGADLVWEFNLQGKGGGIFTVDVHDGACDVVIGRGRRAPDVVYEMDATTWLAMAQSRVTGDEAVLLGRLRITGNPAVARRFNEFFAPAGEPPTPAASRTPEEVAAADGARTLPGVRLFERVLRRSNAA